MIGSSQGFSSAFHSSTNGAAERTNTMIQQYVRCYVQHQQGNWADLLSFTEVAYNNTAHSSTGYTLFYVISGVEFVPIPECPRPKPKESGLQEWVTQMTGVWGHIKDALRKAAETYKSQEDRKRRPRPPSRLEGLPFHEVSKHQSIVQEIRPPNILAHF